MCPADGWIAIVDDDESIRRSLARLLLYNGHVTRTFSSAEEYLSLVPHVAPVCLVLDVNLGGLSGFELQDRLEAAGRAPPIIFITAMDDVTRAQLEARVGPHGYLRKPFATRALLDAVRRYVVAPLEARTA